MPFVPAFPTAGRKTVKGYQYVHGTLLDKSSFSEDLRNKIVTSHIPTLLRNESLHWKKIIVPDAEKQDDLKTIAETYTSPYYAGSAGIVEELLRIRSPHRKAVINGPYSFKTVLIVCGSMHPINRTQINELLKRRGKKRNNFYVIRGPERKTDPDTAARKIVYAVKKLVLKKEFNVIILIGGDTAYRVCRELDIQYLDIVREVEEGIVVTRSDKGRHIILKPGGFGDKNSLVNCV